MRTLIAIILGLAVGLAVQSLRLAYYKAYFDQKQRNLQLLKGLRRVL